MATMEISATDHVEEEDATRLARAGYVPVVRWRRVTEDGDVLVLSSPEAMNRLRREERRDRHRRLRGVR